ncbi:class I SAM-dependent methyltransferase [Candidatus Parcubacteria bacterium]|nr:class I SAM-dependent methyltransferase [Candidatus Parcubacteria bacterium]
MEIVISILLLLVMLFLIALAFVAMSLGALRVPYVTTSTKALESIVNALNIEPSSIVYDLGSGDGKVLFACLKRYPEAQYVGIEGHFFPHFLARRKLKKIGNDSHIKFILGNFFKQDLSNATHIFMYLLIPLIDKLLPKLERELKPGTKLVSCDFPFTNKQPKEILDILGTEERGRCKKLYIYEF